MLEGNDLLDQRNFILVGDLNVSTNIEEVWGMSVNLDPLETLFKELFSKHNFVDVIPEELMPTCHNGRSRVAGIQKILDRVYTLEELLMDSTCYRSWVELLFIFDHMPVFFQLDYGVKPVAYPLKLNLLQIKEESFAILV